MANGPTFSLCSHSRDSVPLTTWPDSISFHTVIKGRPLATGLSAKEPWSWHSLRKTKSKFPEIGLLMQDWDKAECACLPLGLAKPQLGLLAQRLSDRAPSASVGQARPQALSWEVPEGRLFWEPDFSQQRREPFSGRLERQDEGLFAWSPPLTLMHGHTWQKSPEHLKDGEIRGSVAGWNLQDVFSVRNKQAAMPWMLRWWGAQLAWRQGCRPFSGALGLGRDSPGCCFPDSITCLPETIAARLSSCIWWGMVSRKSLWRQAPGRSAPGQRIWTEVLPQAPKGNKEAKGQSCSVRVVAERAGDPHRQEWGCWNTGRKGTK